MFHLQAPLKNPPLNRVELHVHLDGSIRHETLWDLLRQKKQNLPGDGSLADLRKMCKVEHISDLDNFLSVFPKFIPAIFNDMNAIERISEEFVEDKCKDRVAYCEARFAPHLLVDTTTNITNGNSEAETNGNANTPDDVIEAVLRGIQKGQDKTGTKVNLLLCCFRGNLEWNLDVLRLAEKYRDRGVVGIDLIGDESRYMKESGSSDLCDPNDIQVFESAKEKGIHRTVHAGEAAGADSVRVAVKKLHAERVGHGYRVLEDPSLMEDCREGGVHFEACPYSSYLTGSIGDLCRSKSGPVRHPVIEFAEQGVSFGINTDDTTCTHTTLTDEYNLLQTWGFNEAEFTRANFEAAKNTFLSYTEKVELIAQLKSAYGLDSLDIPKPSSQIENGGHKPVESKPTITLGAWADRS